MANAIKKASGVPSLEKYLEMAKQMFAETEPIPFVTNAKGDITFVDPLDLTDSARKSLLKELNSVVLPADIKSARQKLELIRFKIGAQTYSVADLAKPTEKIPLGYIAETILQAAIIARFVMRDKNNTNISAKDIEKYIGAYIKSKEQWNTGQKSTQVNKIVRFDADNLSESFKDKVVGYMSLNKGAYAYLEKTYSKGTLSKDALIGPFFTDSMNYVNKAEPKTHAWYFYTNGKIDLIEIQSTSITGQAEGRKADIITKYREGYTGTPGSGKATSFDLELSIKIKGTTQFGQATNINLTSITKFMSYVGVTLDATTKKKIEKIFADNNIKVVNDKFMLKDKPVTAQKLEEMGVWHQVMTLMYNRINSQVTGTGLPALLSGIMDGIASREEQNRLPDVTVSNAKNKLPARPGLSIVDIGTGANVYDVAKLIPYKKSKGKVTTDLRLGSMNGGGEGKNFKIDIYVANQLLVTLSSRRIQTNFRNYICSGIALRKWMSRPD